MRSHIRINVDHLSWAPVFIHIGQIHMKEIAIVTTGREVESIASCDVIVCCLYHVAVGGATLEAARREVEGGHVDHVGDVAQVGAGDVERTESHHWENIEKDIRALFI